MFLTMERQSFNILYSIRLFMFYVINIDLEMFMSSGKRWQYCVTSHLQLIGHMKLAISPEGLRRNTRRKKKCCNQNIMLEITVQILRITIVSTEGTILIGRISYFVRLGHRSVRSQQLRGLRRRSTAARLLRSWVRIRGVNRQLAFPDSQYIFLLRTCWTSVARLKIFHVIYVKFA